MMVYSVKQLARLAGVSVRTLHYYDHIGLLKPSSYGENGYRYYDESSVILLQQILFFRELGFALDEIRTIVGQPGFNVRRALEEHRVLLSKRADRIAEYAYRVVSQRGSHLLYHAYCCVSITAESCHMES
jgi:DNA-binding transcriptional MerR regulator